LWLEEVAMFSIPLRIGLATAAFVPMIFPATAARASPKVETFCAPSYAPEGFPCRALEPGKLLVLRVDSDLPRGAMLRFIPTGGLGNHMDVRLMQGLRSKSYRVVLPARLCSSRKKTQFQLELLSGDRRPLAPGGRFMVLC
jgi:hypothetical protein